MTIQQAADRWGFSVNWVRALVKAKKVKVEKRVDPIPHYWIADDHPIPVRARRSLKAEAAAAKAAKAAARKATRAKGPKATRRAPKAKAKAKRA